MQIDEELIAIIDKLKVVENKEARELYKLINENSLSYDLTNRLLNYFDKVEDFEAKIKFLGYLLKLNEEPEIYSILGHTYKKLKDFSSAKYYYDKAILLDPTNFIYYYNKGIILYEEENYEDALNCFIESSLCNKNVDLVFYNLGNTYSKLGNHLNAIKCYKRAIELNEKFAEAYFNLGVTYENIKMPEEALKCYEQASLINPNNASFGWNKSLMLLYLKRFSEGFKEYENRIRKHNYKFNLNGKRYKGEDLRSKTLLIYTEQGFGDALLFIRLLPLLKRDNSKIVLFTNNRLIKLFKLNSFADEYYDIHDIFSSEIKYDYYASLLSLPAILNVSLFDSNNICSYIKLSGNEKQSEYKTNNEYYKIGIVWKGNPEPKANRVRHTELKYFKKISELENVKLYSLQLGAGSEIAECGFEIIDLSTGINDFYDTARLLVDLDLLITVDTSVLHLAGSMGINTIALLPNRLDWRWNDINGYSSLYPKVRIIKQDIDYEWEGVFEKLTNEVWGIINNKSEITAELNINVDEVEKQAVSFFNDGKFEKAAESFSIYLQKYPCDKRIINNRGLAYQNSGKYDEAISDYKKAIDLDKNYISARINLVTLLLDLEDFSECENELENLVQLYGYNKDTLFLSALFFHKTHKYDEAERIYLKLREDYEDDLTISMNLGMLYNTIGHYVKAANIFIETSQKYPNTPELYFHLGNVYANYEEYERAINWYMKALNLNTKYLDAYLNLGNAYFNLRRLKDALDLYKQLITFGFVDYRIFLNMGIIYYELKEYKQAEKSFITAMSMETKSAELFLGYSEALLIQGKYKEGWKYYKRRVHKDIVLYPYINKIPNTKEIERNKKILIAGEQGIGDNIMFGRYLFPFAEKYSFTFLIRKDLLKFFNLALKNLPIKISTNENMINYDYVIPLLNLPEYFDTDDSNIPEINYSTELLNTDVVRNRALEKVTTNIGICWKGKKTPFHNRKRHMTLKKMLKTLSGLESYQTTVINLQHELTDFEKELCGNFDIESGAEGNEDLIETCKIISELDIVLTVDTVIAHLAATMGKITYLMLCYSPDWRWGYEGNKSMWYPTVKIFRQNELDNWDNVLNEVNNELRNYLDSRKK